MHDGHTFTLGRDICVIGQKIGGGSFGQVCLLGRQRDRQVELGAIKFFTKTREPPEAWPAALGRCRQMARSELCAMKKVRGPLSNTELIVDSATGRPALIMPLMLGSLADVLDGLGSSSTAQRQLVAEALLPLGGALRELHQRGVAHMDVKPANVLLTAQLTFCLGDFGLATEEPVSETRRGSMVWMAPEVFAFTSEAPGANRRLFETQPTDLFSLGLILLNALTGRNLLDYRSWHHSNCSVERATAFCSSAHAALDAIRPTLWHWLSQEARPQLPTLGGKLGDGVASLMYGRQLLEKLAVFDPRHAAVQNAILLTAKEPRARSLAPWYRLGVGQPQAGGAGLAQLLEQINLPTHAALAGCPLLGHQARVEVALGERALLHPGLLWSAHSPLSEATDSEAPSSSWTSAASEPLEPADGAPLPLVPLVPYTGDLVPPGGGLSGEPPPKKGFPLSPGLGSWRPLKRLFRSREYGRHGQA